MLKFSFGYPTSGIITSEFADSVSRLMIYEAGKENAERNLGSFLGSQKGCMVNANRAELTKAFLEFTKDHYLVMIDADIEFGPDLLEALNREIDEFYNKVEVMPHIIGGRVNIYPGLPVFYSLNEKGYSRNDKNKFEGLKEFYAVGFGIICLSRVVLSHLVEEFKGHYSFYNPMDDNGINTTDDFSFCHHARNLDYKIYGSWGIFGMHWKPAIIDSLYQE